jgi:hypothetical protein
MNSFQNLNEKNQIFIWWSWRFFFVINFQANGLAHDHGLLQLINPPWFGIALNNDVEIFVYKYLIIFNQTIISF